MISFDRRLLLVFLFLPQLALLGLFARETLYRTEGKLWRVEVQAYDPRDLLRGRYAVVNFANTWEMRSQAAQCSSTSKCHLCFQKTGVTTDGTSLAHFVLKYDSPQNSACVSFLAGTAIKQFFDPQRFYVPESIADETDRALRNRSNRVAADILILNPTTYRLKNLYINGTKVAVNLHD